MSSEAECLAVCRVARPVPKELSVIDDRNRDTVIEWLNDRLTLGFIGNMPR
jgi:hypothetical protein